MGQGLDQRYVQRIIRRQVDNYYKVPSMQYVDIHTLFRTIYGQRSSEYAYALAYIAALETAEPIQFPRARDSGS